MTKKIQEPKKKTSGEQVSTGSGGELHQLAGGTHPALIAQTGVIVAEEASHSRSDLLGMKEPVDECRIF